MGEGRMGLDWMDQGPNGKTKRWTTHNHNRGSVTKRSVEGKLSGKVGFSISLVHFHGTNSLHLSLEKPLTASSSIAKRFTKTLDTMSEN